MAQLKVGLIGAGNMGQGMALRMLDEGVDLTVCDRKPAALAPLRERGAKLADTPVVLADSCELIIASMPSREVSLAVALGDQGVVNGKALRVYVETSTLGSGTIEKIATGLRAKGIGLIDAPVSGGPPGARAGTLAVLSSGSEEDFSFALPVLNVLGKPIYLGDKPGISQVAKIINNHVGIIELAEDLDIETVTEIFIRVNSAGAELSQADFAMSKIAANDMSNLGDTSTLADPAVVDDLVKNRSQTPT